MVALYHPCEQRHEFWGELWWVGDGHRWMFFDQRKTSNTHAESVTRCPSCARSLERSNVRRVTDR